MTSSPSQIRYKAKRAESMSFFIFQGRYALTRRPIFSSRGIEKWEEVKIQMLDDNLAPVAGECYAKVISVKHAQGRYECLMRFTSVPPEALEALRQAAGA